MILGRVWCPFVALAWTPPTYNHTVVDSFANKTLASPSHYCDDNPYKNGTVPTPGRANDTSVRICMLRNFP